MPTNIVKIAARIMTPGVSVTSATIGSFPLGLPPGGTVTTVNTDYITWAGFDLNSNCSTPFSGNPTYVVQACFNSTVAGPFDVVFTGYQSNGNQCCINAPVSLTLSDPSCMPACTPHPPGMVAWYTGDDTSPIDHLGEHDGTYVGNPISSFDWKVGGGALEFHSPDTYVIVPDPVPGSVQDNLDFGTDDFSIDMWVKTYAINPPPAIQPLVDKRTGSLPLAYGYQVVLYNGNLLVHLADGGGSSGFTNYISSLPVPNDGDWHFLAVTVERNNPAGLVMYVDNYPPQVFNPTGRQGNLNNSADLRIGANYPISAGNCIFDGLMDEIEFFNRALTSSEIDKIRQADSAGKCKCADPPPDMVGWWTLDETAGTTAHDFLAHKDGTYQPSGSGPIQTPAYVKHGLQFDGVSDYVDVPANQTPLKLGTSDLTVDAWIYWDPTSTSINDEIVTQSGYRFRLVDGPTSANLLLWLTGGSNSKCISFAPPDVLPGNTWVHVAATLEQQNSPSVCKLYINGRLVHQSNPIGVDNLSNDGAARIGASFSGTSSFFKGLIDEVEIFNRALDATEILRIYRADRVGKCKNGCGHLPPPPTPIADPSGIDKNRFISFLVPGATASRADANEDNGVAGSKATPLPGDRSTDATKTLVTRPANGTARGETLAVNDTAQAAAGETALRVTLVSLMHPDPPNLPQYPAPNFTAFEGEVRWVGPPAQYIESTANPTTFFASSLQCTPYYRDWSTIGLLHVTGSAVVPSSIYEVEQVAASCMGSEESCCAVSAPLSIETTRWGDILDTFQLPSPAALTQPDVRDISSLVDKFRGVPGAIIKARALLAGNDAYGNINTLGLDVSVSQIAACVDAFKGEPYPFTIEGCP